jgi:hypothetical protein
MLSAGDGEHSGVLLDAEVRPDGCVSHPWLEIVGVT